MPISLEEFAAQQPSSCSICSLPSDILAEVNAGLRNGLGVTLVDAWLATDQGIKTVSVKWHKTKNHYLENQ